MMRLFHQTEAFLKRLVRLLNSSRVKGQSFAVVQVLNWAHGTGLSGFTGPQISSSISVHQVNLAAAAERGRVQCLIPPTVM